MRWAYHITQQISRHGEYPDRRESRKQQRVGGNDR